MAKNDEESMEMNESQVMETEFISLAQLADMQTDEIAVLTSRLPAAGIFTVRGVEVKASESPPKEPGQLPLFRFAFRTEILEAQPLSKDRDPDSFIGRNLTESYTLWPNSFEEAIGLLKGRYQLIGLPNNGRLGGVEGVEPGWLDGIVNHIFKIRVRHYTDGKGNERAGFDYLPYKNPDAEENEAA